MTYLVPQVEGIIKKILTKYIQIRESNLVEQPYPAVSTQHPPAEIPVPMTINQVQRPHQASFEGNTLLERGFWRKFNGRKMLSITTTIEPVKVEDKMYRHATV